MDQSQIQSAAADLIDRRLNNKVAPRLAPNLRPGTTDEAFAIQQAMMEGMGDEVGGWKCLLPTEDKVFAAPIFARTIFDQSPCPIKLDNGVCRIEPEIAFKFKQDLPSRNTDYSEQEIIAALSSAYLALELIQNRYQDAEPAGFAETLADCLINQGIYVGPEIDMARAFAASEIDFTLTQQETRTFTGRHPNNSPQLPLFWLVNFLSKRGIDIKAGQVVITGSFAGAHEVKPNIEFTLDYAGLDKINVTLQH